MSLISPPLILASSSPYRVELMRRLGVPFEARSHRFDESSLKAEGLTPDALAAALADAKAASLREAFPDRTILGSDQVADLDGEVLDKPETAERAEVQLAMLAGRTHRLLTAVTLLCPDGRTFRALDIHHLTMRPLTAVAIADYVRRDVPLDCCGSYKIERLGIALFSAIDGADFTAIMGLPMIAVVNMLAKAGVSVLTAAEDT